MATAPVTRDGNNLAVNRAKGWQIALFPFNNAATNVYFAFYNYFTYWAFLYLTGSTGAAIGGTIISAALAMAVTHFNALFAPLMRIFDGITDPMLGVLMDRTHGKLGKRGIPFDGGVGTVFSWIVYIISYVIYVIGYTGQGACTKAGQTALTNDPKQRSQFVIWNMIGMIGSIVLVNVMAGGVLVNEAICAKGAIFTADTSIWTLIGNGSIQDINGTTYTVAQLLRIGVEEMGQLPAGVALNRGASYGLPFYNIMVPFVIVVSAIYTTMAVAAIWNKDRPEFWGVGQSSMKFKDTLKILKDNKEIRWLVTSSGLNKLASTVATSGTVAFLVYGCLMGDYNGLFIPFYALCFVFMGLFFVWGSATAGKKGQKRGVAQFTAFAFLFYIGLLIMLIVWNKDNPATHLSLYSMEGGFHLTINFYTILFIILYGCGYGAFNCCDNLTIPMVADVTDYETYRSGNYVPGAMGTIFSLIDKIISSLQTLLLTLFIVTINPNVNALPAEGTPYVEGMQLSAIICFCLLPMIAWLVTLFCMTRYSLSGDRLREIQAVNAVRKAAIEGGMSKEEAMATWNTIDQVPAVFVYSIKEKKPAKENFLDRAYAKVFSRKEKIGAPASSNAVDIPERYRTEAVKGLMASQQENE